MVSIYKRKDIRGELKKMEKIIDKFEKNKMEEVRVVLQEYKGADLIDIRIWLKNDGRWVRTRKGITLNMGLLPELKEAILKAEKVIEKSIL